MRYRQFVSVIDGITTIEIGKIIRSFFQRGCINVGNKELIESTFFLKLSVVKLLNIKNGHINKPVPENSLQVNGKPPAFAVGFIFFCTEPKFYNISRQADIHLYDRSWRVMAGKSFYLDVFNFMFEQRKHVDAMKVTAIIIAINELLYFTCKKLYVIRL